MGAEHDDPAPIRRGKGLRLSTPAAPPEAPPNEPPPTPAEEPPPRRRGGLRLSTTGGAAEGGRAEPAPAAPPAAPAPPATAAPARLRAATAGGPTSYLRAGQGRPLLLVHGFGASARLWAGTLAALADLRTIYAIDLPGFGASPPRPAAPTLAALADEVLGLADALGLQEFDLAGHSLGAAVAALVAGRQPGRVGRLATISLGARAFAPELAALGLSRGAMDVTLGLARPLLDLWQPLGRALMQSPPLALTVGSLVLYGQPASPELWWDYLADHAKADPRAYLTSLTAVADPALHDALRRITAPTLCIAGREDRVARLAETTTAQAMIAGSTLRVIDGCGHMPMIERPGPLHLALRELLRH